MNRELIKKYKVEFDHWLNGGKILYASYDLDEKNYSAWYELHHDCKWDYNNAYRFKFIINDAFVEFRKALAEEKIVEFKHPQVGYDEWEIVTPEHLFQSVVSGRQYRIKPEEPKFKVGDWVIHKRKGICKIEKISPSNEPDDKNIWLENKGACFINELELWEPKEEEYFWYKNDLVKFDEIKTNFGTLLESIRGCSYHTAEENFEDYCEPFIGQLPTILKE